MSNVVSPRGPLPPRVYWRRRLLVLALVCGVALLAGRLLGGGEGTRPTAGPAGPGRTPAPQAGPTPAQSAGGASPRAAPPAAAGVQTRAAALTGAGGPLAPPAGACAASDVVVSPDVEDADAHGVVPLRLGLSTNGDRACTFAFGPDSVAVEITSGDDLVWQSQVCPQQVPRRSMVLRPGWLSYVSVHWPGRRSGDTGCGSGDFADPGYYWAEAAAIGAVPESSQFMLEDPPQPRPTQQPARPRPSEASGAGDATSEHDRGGADNGDRSPDQPADAPSDRPTGADPADPADR